MKKKRIILINSKVEYQEIYDSILRKHKRKIIVTYYQSLNKFKYNDDKNSYSGIIIDCETFFYSCKDDKEMFNYMIMDMPIIIVNPKDENVCCIVENIEKENLSKIKLFDYFIERICQTKPRKIRKHYRKDVFFDVKIIDGVNKYNLNLIDISAKGCFIVSSVIPKGRIIQIIILNLRDHTPISCTIRWKVQWGKKENKLSGFGLEFNKLTEDQLIEIIEEVI